MSAIRKNRPVLLIPEKQPEDLTNDQRCAAHAEPISEVLPHLFLGSWRDAEDASVIMSHGITHILNVAKELPPPSEIAAMDAVVVGAKKQIPLMDAHSQDIITHFETAFEFIDAARAAGGRVLVHCRRGISRSPAIVVGYLMTHFQHSYESAVTFVKEKRTSVSLNLAFRTVLEEYKPLPPSENRNGKGSPLSPSSEGTGAALGSRHGSSFAEGLAASPEKPPAVGDTESQRANT